jgi:hypothetical protein
VQVRQQPELLRHDQRRVVAEQHRAGADPDVLGGRGDGRDQHGGRRRGDTGRQVVLGQPVPAVAQPFGVPGEVERVAQGVRDAAPRHDGREVQD